MRRTVIDAAAMIKVDESDPVGELEPSFPYKDITIRRGVDMKEHYELQSEIGRGKFGTVFKCREKSTGLMLAAKFVGIVHKQDRRNVEREVEIMCELQHPRLIQLYDAFEANNAMCFILELVEGGELFERVIGDDFVLTEKAVTIFMRQICEGVQFIHSKNILHLDLKPENILCLTKTGNRIKIIDFGLARKFNPANKLQVLFGTPEFVAPEVVNFDAIGFGTDMWSVGVICYVLLSGLSPFMGETDVETMANVTIAQYDFDDEAFDSISNDAKDFIKKLLIKDHKSRLTATECLAHRWLQKKKTSLKKAARKNSSKKLAAAATAAAKSRPNETELPLDASKENLKELCRSRSVSPTDVMPVPGPGKTMPVPVPVPVPSPPRSKPVTTATAKTEPPERWSTTTTTSSRSTATTVTGYRRSSDVSYMYSSVVRTSGPSASSADGGGDLLLGSELRGLSERLQDLHSQLKDAPDDGVGAGDGLRQLLAVGRLHQRVEPTKPKFRFSNANRDVPVGSPPPASNLLYYMTAAAAAASCRSAPHSHRTSPEHRDSAKEMLLKLFYRGGGTAAGDGPEPSTSAAN